MKSMSRREDARVILQEDVRSQLWPRQRAERDLPVLRSYVPDCQDHPRTGKPPAHRMYAKLVLLPEGSKPIIRPRTRTARFTPRPNAHGQAQECVSGCRHRTRLQYQSGFGLQLPPLARDVQCAPASVPVHPCRPHPRDPDSVLRELFTCLFSGALEFNNMFASYKGEGTGAVRHMFAHHILKPERVPLEANLWGTEKSSGSFSTMFEGRIRRALDYADDPFEFRVTRAARPRKFSACPRQSARLSRTITPNSRGTARLSVLRRFRSTDLPDLRWMWS